MSWLYERREHLNGLRPFVEIAHRLIFPIPSLDRDDAEQEIVITLKRVTEKRGEVAKNYLWGTARNVVRLYWRKRYQHAKRVCHLCESDRGEMVPGEWQYVSNNGDNDARLDPIATLSILPKRLVEIGYKRLNGERLSEAVSGIG